METRFGRLTIAILSMVVLMWPAGVLAAPPIPPGTATQPSLPAAPAPGGTVHVVQWGESLELIAGRYGVAVSTLAAANGLPNPNLIYVGQRLVIPSTGGSPAPGPGTHTVSAGETLSSIAFRYKTTVAALASINNLSNADLIFMGQVLTLPGGQPLPPSQPAAGGCGTVITVGSGDTLSALAWQYGTTISALMQANNLRSTTIYVDQRLVIPTR